MIAWQVTILWKQYGTATTTLTARYDVPTDDAEFENYATNASVSVQIPQSLNGEKSIAREKTSLPSEPMRNDNSLYDIHLPITYAPRIYTLER